MSEPVGNGPRQGPPSIPAIPSNSHKSREEAPEGRPKMEKVIEGKVVIKKPSVWKRITSNIIADDARTVGDYIIEDVFVPALKNLAYDIVVGGMRRTLFGGRLQAGSPLSGRVGVGTNPVSQILGGGIRARYEPIPEARYQLPHEDRSTHNFDNMVMTVEQARAVIESLIARFQRYHVVSVADLYDAMGVTGSFADQRHGWTDLGEHNADIRQVPGGFVLRLPKPQPLR